MSNLTYIPILKTGDAELRGVEQLDLDAKKQMMPLFELTRSRISKRSPDGDIYRRLARLKQAYENQFILDLTGDPVLINTQIEDCQDNTNGYEKWIKFLDKIRPDFPEVVPTIQISDEGVSTESEYYSRIEKQVASLHERFDLICFRFPIDYTGFKKDLDAINNQLGNSKLIVVIDAEFIRQNTADVYGVKVRKMAEYLIQKGIKLISVCATSFPRNPIAYGDDEQGEYRLEEYHLHKAVNHLPLIYGDYATIHPLRSPQAGGSGWVPRIDLPTTTHIFYRRSRKTELETSYAPAYTRAAKKIVALEQFHQVSKDSNNCWGIKQIETAASNSPEGLSPSFWISVRMNINMSLRARSLGI